MLGSRFCTAPPGIAADVAHEGNQGKRVRPRRNQQGTSGECADQEEFVLGLCALRRLQLGRHYGDAQPEVHGCEALQALVHAPSVVAAVQGLGEGQEAGLRNRKGGERESREQRERRLGMGWTWRDRWLAQLSSCFRVDSLSERRTASGESRSIQGLILPDLPKQVHPFIRDGHIRDLLNVNVSAHLSVLILHSVLYVMSDAGDADPVEVEERTNHVAAPLGGAEHQVRTGEWRGGAAPECIGGLLAGSVAGIRLRGRQNGKLD